jgi:hypothetical protein
MVKPRRAVSSLLAFALAFASLAACSTDKPGAPAPADHKTFCNLPKPCQEIAQACHAKDDGTPGTVHECHETGHDVGTLEACSKVHDSCMKACAEAKALTDGPVEDLGMACHKDAAVGG